MFSTNVIMATSVITFIVLFTSSTINALAMSNEKNINDVKENYTISDDVVILHSLVGDIKIPIPEEIQRELNADRMKNSQIEEKPFERLSMYGSSNADNNIRSPMFADFFACNDHAISALSVHREEYRYWEPFFKRNLFEDTAAVRYCCNFFEYLGSVETTIPSDCRQTIHLKDQAMNSKVRSTCDQYDIHGVECFLVRWMYWWITAAVFTVIVLIIVFVCCAMKRRRSRAYSKARQEEKITRTSLVNGV